MIEKRLERIRPSISRLQRTDFEQTRERVVFYAIRAVTPVLREGQENIARDTNVEFDEGFWESYIELRKQGYHPINVSNHTAHQDADSMSLVVKQQMSAEKFLPKKSRIKGFQLPLAMSLANGDQGAAMQAVYLADKPLIIRRGLVPLLLTRDKDVENFNAEKNLIAYYRQLREAINENWGIAVLPEGTTTGGKRNKNGDLNGMQVFPRDSLRSIISATNKEHKKPMIIPVGIDGGYRIFNPDSQLPTRRALRVGLHLNRRNSRSIVNVSVGLPMKADEDILGDLVESKHWQAINELIGNEIASRIPMYQGGKYGEHYFSS